jgi:hypothetical protein
VLLNPDPFVPDPNGNFFIGHAAAVDVNILVRIFMVAVNNTIGQGFSQRDFNVNFVSRNTLTFLDEDHEFLYEG